MFVDGSIKKRSLFIDTFHFTELYQFSHSMSILHFSMRLLFSCGEFVALYLGIEGQFCIVTCVNRTTDNIICVF